MCRVCASARVRCSPRYKVAHCFVRCACGTMPDLCFRAGDVTAGWQKLRKLGEQVGSWELWESEWEVELTTGCQVWS